MGKWYPCHSDDIIRSSGDEHLQSNFHVSLRSFDVILAVTGESLRLGKQRNVCKPQVGEDMSKCWSLCVVSGIENK